jgi:hypothetical protein
MDKNLHQNAKVPMIALILFNLFVFSLIAKTQDIFGGGIGTEEYPYLISTTDHLDQLATKVNNGNNYSGKFFLMTADLDYSGKPYNPVGCMRSDGVIRHFAGFFDGNYHTITNVQHIVTYTDVPSYIGVFGMVGTDGTVQNLTLDQSSIGAVIM